MFPISLRGLVLDGFVTLTILDGLATWTPMSPNRLSFDLEFSMFGRFGDMGGHVAKPSPWRNPSFRFSDGLVTWHTVFWIFGRFGDMDPHVAKPSSRKPPSFHFSNGLAIWT